MNFKHWILFFLLSFQAFSCADLVKGINNLINPQAGSHFEWKVSKFRSKIQPNSAYGKTPELIKDMEAWKKEVFDPIEWAQLKKLRFNKAPKVKQIHQQMIKNLKSKSQRLETIAKKYPRYESYFSNSIDQINRLAQRIEINLQHIEDLSVKNLYHDDYEFFRKEKIIAANDRTPKSQVELSQRIGIELYFQQMNPPNVQPKEFSRVLKGLMPLNWPIPRPVPEKLLTKRRLTRDEKERVAKRGKMLEEIFDQDSEEHLRNLELNYINPLRSEVAELETLLASENPIAKGVRFMSVRGRTEAFQNFALFYLNRATAGLGTLKQRIRNKDYETLKEKYPELMRTKVKGKAAQYAALDSAISRVLDKEIDVITKNSDGTFNWIEVKTQRGAFGTSKHHNVGFHRQHRLTKEILSLLGLTDKVRIKYSFPYGITASMAKSLEDLGIDFDGDIIEGAVRKS